VIDRIRPEVAATLFDQSEHSVSIRTIVFFSVAMLDADAISGNPLTATTRPSARSPVASRTRVPW